MGHHDENTAPVNQGQNKKDNIVKINSTELHTPNKILEGMSPTEEIQFLTNPTVTIYFAGLPVSTWNSKNHGGNVSAKTNSFSVTAENARKYVRFDFHSAPHDITINGIVVDKHQPLTNDMKVNARVVSQKYKLEHTVDSSTPGTNKAPYCEFWPVFEEGAAISPSMTDDHTKMKYLNINKSLKSVDVDGKITKVTFAVYNPETGEEYTQYFGVEKIVNPSNSFTAMPHNGEVSSVGPVVYNGKVFAPNQLWGEAGTEQPGLGCLTYCAAIPKDKDFMVKFSISDNGPGGLTERKILVKADGSIINKTTP